MDNNQNLEARIAMLEKRMAALEASYPPVDWDQAEDYLRRMEAVRTELVDTAGGYPIFSSGVLDRLRIRFDDGERTRRLYDEIVELEKSKLR